LNSADPTVDFDRFVGLDMTTLLYPEPVFGCLGTPGFGSSPEDEPPSSSCVPPDNLRYGRVDFARAETLIPFRSREDSNGQRLACMIPGRLD
jgi:hypothetical protein